MANITLATKPQGTLASLDSLAATVRSAHTAVGLAARKVLDHALTAGDALLAAKDRLEHGKWLPWLKKHCDISERQAQNYMVMASNRMVLEANPHLGADLTIKGALRLIKPPSKPSSPKKVRARKPSEKLDRHAVQEWFSSASIEEQRRLFDGLGPHAVARAVPPAWANEFAKLLIEREPLVLTAPTTQPAPADGDLLEIPPYLRRDAQNKLPA